MTNFSEVILDADGNKIYENDEELFDDLIITDENEENVKTNGISCEWQFASNEMQNLLSILDERIGDPKTTKEECASISMIFDEIMNKVEPAISKRLGKKVIIISLDNSEESGMYEIKE